MALTCKINPAKKFDFLKQCLHTEAGLAKGSPQLTGFLLISYKSSNAIVEMLPGLKAPHRRKCAMRRSEIIKVSQCTVPKQS